MRARAAKFLDWKTVFVAVAASCPLVVNAVENGRLLEFTAQASALPLSAPSATVSNSSGSITITPVGPGTIRFVSWQTWAAGAPGSALPGTTYAVKPSSSAVPYRLSIADLRVSSTVYISAKCVNPSTLALEACNLGDISVFPRTDFPPSGWPYVATASAVWDSTAQQLMVTTPWLGSMDTQSNGFYVDLPPYVREITYQATNSGGQDYIAGAVWVADAPSVTKAMAPAVVKPGQHTTLTVTLKNPDLGAPVPGANVIDELPAPLQVVSATHTCTGGTMTAVAGTSRVELKGASIPVGGCTITADVVWPDSSAGIAACQATPKVTNSITPPAQFSTAIGQMDTVASAPLNCTYVPPPTAVPTLGAWALWLLAAAMGWVGVRRVRT